MNSVMICRQCAKKVAIWIDGHNRPRCTHCDYGHCYEYVDTSIVSEGGVFFEFREHLSLEKQNVEETNCGNR